MIRMHLCFFGRCTFSFFPRSFSAAPSEWPLAMSASPDELWKREISGSGSDVLAQNPAIKDHSRYRSDFPSMLHVSGDCHLTPTVSKRSLDNVTGQARLEVALLGSALVRKIASFVLEKLWRTQRCFSCNGCADYFHFDFDLFCFGLLIFLISNQIHVCRFSVWCRMLICCPSVLQQQQPCLFKPIISCFYRKPTVFAWTGPVQTSQCKNLVSM